MAAATSFSDTFSGTALNTNNWSTNNYGGTGAGGGASGSVTTVNNGLILNASTNNRWISAWHSDYAVGGTETFQATVTNVPSATTGVGFSIYLASGTGAAPGTATNPAYTAPNLLELRYSVSNTNQGYGTVALYGKLNSASNYPTTTLGYLPLSKLQNTYLPNAGNGTANIGLTIYNSGTNTIATIFYNLHNSPQTVPVSQTIRLSDISPNYYTNFDGQTYLYLMARGASGTSESIGISQFSATNGTAQTANIAVNSNAPKQNVVGLGGNYEKDEFGPTSYVLDNCGTNTLNGLKPTWARIPIPMSTSNSPSWDPAWQGLAYSPDVWPATGWMTNFPVVGNMTNNFAKIPYLMSGGVSNFIFSVWGLSGWLTDQTNYDTSNPNGRWQLSAGSSTAPQYLLQGIAAYLLTAKHLYPQLDLNKVYLSMNEPDMGANTIMIPSAYANLIALSPSVFNRLGLTNGNLGLTNNIKWLAGETAEVYGTGQVTYNYGATNVLGAVIWSGFTNSYTDQVLHWLSTNTICPGVVTNTAIGFHAYDDASPLRLSWIQQMANHYGSTTPLPIITDEVGQEDWFNPTNTGANYANIAPSWDNAWKTAHVYQDALNYSGAMAGMLWSFSDGWPILDNTTSAKWPIYYVLQTMETNMPPNSVVLTTTNTGNIESMAWGHSNNPHVLQILQPDSRPVTLSVSGLFKSHAYSMYVQCATNTGQNSAATDFTTDASGHATLNLPSEPVEFESTNNTGTNVPYWDSGAVVTLTDLVTN